MKISRYIFAGISATAMMGFYGCGSGGSIDVVDPNAAPSAAEQVVNALGFVGSAKCIECHELSHPALVGDYLEGIHVVHGTGVNAASGESCLQCHDPIGDGRLIQDRVPAANVPTEGLAAVGCEGCHGGNGSGHYEVVSPLAVTCGQCHDSNHITDNPEGNNIYSDYLAGNKHSKAPTHLGAPCVKCHTDEGGRMYKDIHTVDGLETVLADAASPIQCRTCHNAHNPDKLLLAATASESAQYNTCTNCHQRHDAQVVAAVTPLFGGTQTGTTDGSSGDLIYHGGRWTRVISSTHYDNPVNDATTPVIEGYIMGPANERVCLDCHNVHSADITINQQWARSGHGGRILAAKEAAALTETDKTIAQVIAVRAAGVTAATGNAWVSQGGSGTTSCGTRCHTATGAASYLNNPTAYTPASLLFPYRTGSQKEMLYCWGCHTQAAAGVLRTPGAITKPGFNGVGATVMDYTFNGTAVSALPDLTSSNGCVPCHLGRYNRDGIVNGTRSSSAKIHHGAAAATLFSKEIHPGYEFKDAGGVNFLQYDSTIKNDGSSASFMHRDIGTFKVDGTPYKAQTGTSGPCVACHMGPTGTANHEFGLAGLGGGTCGTSAGGVAGACHATTMTVTVLEEESADFQQALTLLNLYLTKGGGYNNYLNTDVVANSATVEIDAYGAFQNWKYLSDEAAAYVHNRKYARRLVFDSIDKLDNGVMDGTITINMTNYPLAGAWLGADAGTGVALRY